MYFGNEFFWRCPGGDGKDFWGRGCGGPEKKPKDCGWGKSWRMSDGRVSVEDWPGGAGGEGWRAYGEDVGLSIGMFTSFPCDPVAPKTSGSNISE